MTFDPTKPVQTKGGRKARIIAIDRLDRRSRDGDDAPFPIVALVKSHDGRNEDVWSYMADGTWWGDENDLVNVPEERDVWVNVYNNTYSTTHPDQEHADRSARIYDYARVALLRVRFTVGQMDD